MSVPISIDGNSVAIILDGQRDRPLGTGFAFIRPNWLVTAKHVVTVDGIHRDNLQVIFYAGKKVAAKVIFTLAQTDLAVLELASDVCSRPLAPGHHSLIGSQGLVCAGYAPSLTGPDSLSVHVNRIETYQSETRERDDGEEQLIVFEAAFSEGGHSGAPIFGAGGAVVGVVIDNFVQNGKTYARATGLAPLVRALRFGI